MRWGRFVRDLLGVVVIYILVLLVFQKADGQPWPLLSYFVALKEVSLIILIYQGVEAVRMAGNLGIKVPTWLQRSNGVILVVAAVAGLFSILKSLGVCTNNMHGVIRDVTHAGIEYAPVMCLLPMFFYTLLNVFVVSRRALDANLRDRIHQYLVFADLTCAVPAALLVFLVWSVSGLTSPDGETALAIGAGMLIFVSNTAASAVNELRPKSEVAPHV